MFAAILSSFRRTERQIEIDLGFLRRKQPMSTIPAYDTTNFTVQPAPPVQPPSATVTIPQAVADNPVVDEATFEANLTAFVETNLPSGSYTIAIS